VHDGGGGGGAEGRLHETARIIFVLLGDKSESSAEPPDDIDNIILPVSTEDVDFFLLIVGVRLLFRLIVLSLISFILLRSPLLSSLGVLEPVDRLDPSA